MNKKHKQKSGILKIKVHYEKSNDYCIYYIDGAISGITPRQKVYIDFFTEKFQEPNESLIEINIAKEKGTESSLTGNKTNVVREKITGLILQADSAITIGKLLMEKGEYLLKTMKEPFEITSKS